MHKALLLLAAGICNIAAWAADEVTLSFNRTSTNAASVSVSGANNATAQITSASHPFKTLTNNAIICPNVNGNTAPNITLTISISNLPTNLTFGTVGLNIHALNASGAYQQNNDGKERRWNVDVAINGSTFASYNNIDIAAGVPGCHQVWTQTASQPLAATSPLTITLSITAGTANAGCFFGLESITLTAANIASKPDPNQAKCYTIKWKNNTDRYMTEAPDGGIIAGDYATTNPLFWELIPTSNTDCFYIRNTASGNYIGSCNMTPSSASKVKMSQTPVEYFVHISSATSGDNAGCYWLSSTDCSTYSTESTSTRALNKDGASNSIITWTAAPSNLGSYWTLTPSDNLYEVRPFAPNTAYHIINPQGLAYSAAANAWVELNPASLDQQWQFLGNSNSEGGYQIVNLADNTPLNGGMTYKVGHTTGSTFYHFTNSQDQRLNLAQSSEFSFMAARSSLALNLQLYRIPCGSTGEVYIKQATVASALHYPMPQVIDGAISLPIAPAPTNKYTLLSRDAAIVTPNSQIPLTLNFNRAPANYSVSLHFDWNCDGVFEATQTLNTPSALYEGSFTVPASATPGNTRLRIRISNNGSQGADDDVHGQILDLQLRIVSSNNSTPLTPIVKSNDPKRGSASWLNGIASATPSGNSLFLYWAEQARILSVDPTIDLPAAPQQREVTAFFTPNTQETTAIAPEIISHTDSSSHIICHDGIITVSSPTQVLAIILFAPNGARIAGTNSPSLAIKHLHHGTYICKAITANGSLSAKINL